MWVVLDAEPGASLYYGFDREVSLEEFSSRVSDGTLTEVLRKVPRGGPGWRGPFWRQ